MLAFTKLHTFSVWSAHFCCRRLSLRRIVLAFVSISFGCFWFWFVILTRFWTKKTSTKKTRTREQISNCQLSAHFYMIETAKFVEIAQFFTLFLCFMIESNWIPHFLNVRHVKPTLWCCCVFIHHSDPNVTSESIFPGKHYARFGLFHTFIEIKILENGKLITKSLRIECVGLTNGMRDYTVAFQLWWCDWWSIVLNVLLNNIVSLFVNDFIRFWQLQNFPMNYSNRFQCKFELIHFRKTEFRRDDFDFDFDCWLKNFKLKFSNAAIWIIRWVFTMEHIKFCLFFSIRSI